MTRTRQLAVAAIREVGLCCTLAVVVTRGINESEIGEIVNFSLDNIDVVRAINFQSAARFTEFYADRRHLADHRRYS